MGSSRKNGLDLSGYDWLGIGLVLVLILIGWAMIFASAYAPENYQGLLDFKKNYGKQLLWILVGLGAALGLQFIEGKFFQSFAFVFFALTGLLLVAVLFTKPINGATSWFNIAGFRLQPSEFAKTATNLALAALLAMPDMRMQSLQNRAKAFGLLALPTGLILLQGDAGSTLVYVAFLLVLFRAGLPAGLYIAGISIAALSILALVFDEIWPLVLFLLMIANFVLLRSWRKDERWTIGLATLFLLSFIFYSNALLFYQIALYLALFITLSTVNLLAGKWQITSICAAVLMGCVVYMSSVSYLVNKVLRSHQQERIWVWLRPEKCDPLGPLYNLEQSKFAIGSGGLMGKGFLEGERTKLDYVPEQSTDFIFCTVGEEWGFFGSFIVIALFTTLLLRILHIAERQRAAFSKFYAYGVAMILFIHLFVNIGMTMGLLPVIGIPLPFISYGGSSLISFSILLAILFKLDSQRMTIFR